MDGSRTLFSSSLGLLTAVVAACTLCLPAAVVAHAGPQSAIDFIRNGIGVPPEDFEFWRSGHDARGDWAVVRDPSATAGASIEQFSSATTENRFPLAIYKPISTEDAKVSVRFKIVRGTMQSAGVAVRLRTPDDYYVIRASALETRVDLLRVADGKMERIADADADVMVNQWHTLGVVVEKDRFDVSFDGKPIFTAWDQSFSGDGHVALWTEEDNVTRFDAITIQPLPRSITD